MKFPITLFLLFLMASFLAHAQYSEPVFDVQGHRGARGLRPENTIPAFLAALDTGVTTLELDLAVSKDLKLVVSHEPWMRASICSRPDGTTFSDKEEMKFNLFQMDYQEIRQWDCGSRGNPAFPQQVKMAVSKPLLYDVIGAVEDHIRSKSRYLVDYNIEIKSDSLGDNIFHPTPDVFSDLVVGFLDQYLPLERVVIQSFDFRVLKYIHQKYPKVRLAALTENGKTMQQNLDALGFVPDIWSPDFRQLDRQTVTRLHQLKPTARSDKKVRVIPWTVNETRDMLSLKGMGVDGFITDYPDRAHQYRSTLKLKSR